MNPTERRNSTLNAAGEALFGFKANLIASATVLTVLLREYGASPRLIGAVWSIETAGALLPQLLGLYVFHSYRQRKRRLILWHMVVMLPVLGVMSALTCMASSLDPAVYRWSMLAGHAYYWLMIGVVNAAWSDFLAGIFPTSIRGTVMGLAMFAASFAGALGGLVAGYLIRSFPAPQVYAALYGVAWGLGTLSMCLWIPVDDTALRDSTEPPPPSIPLLAKHFAHSLADGNFRAFLLARILATLGFCIIPFIALRFMDPASGGLSRSTIVSCGAVMTLGFSLGSLVMGPLGDRYGHRLGVLLGSGLQVVALLVLLFIPGLAGCILAYGCAGICNACGCVSHYNMIFETCPHEHRMAHISIGSLLIGAPMAFAAVLAGLIAEWSSLDAVFGLCLALSAMAFVWCLLRVKEPRTLKLAAGSL
jgi:MFS family permease